MMTRTFFRRLELEPPPWLYVLLAKGPLFRRIYRRLAGTVAGEAPPGARLLDVGTGPGYLLAHLSRQRPDLKLFGLDLSPAMLAGGRRRWRESSPEVRVDGLVGNAQALPVRGASLDRILVTFSFHIWQDPIRAAAEMLRVLKPQGRAFIYEMNREVPRPQLKAFAREERLPFWLVYLGFHSLAVNHALGAEDFASVLRQAGVSSWTLLPAHHLFWQAEIVKD